MDKLCVIQADRDAAADYLDTRGWGWEACGSVREGRIDHPVVQALSAHRIASQAELVEALKAAQYRLWQDGYTLSDSITRQIEAALSHTKGEGE